MKNNTSVPIFDHYKRNALEPEALFRVILDNFCIGVHHYII